jgi:hypothetical protein
LHRIAEGNRGGGLPGNSCRRRKNPPLRTDGEGEGDGVAGEAGAARDGGGRVSVARQRVYLPRDAAAAAE